MATKHDMHVTFESVADLIAEASKPPRLESNRQHHDRVCEWGWMCADRPHITTRGVQDVEALAEPLFEAGVSRIASLTRNIAVPTPVSIKRRLTRGDHGDELDMPRVWQGELDTAWTRAARQATVAASRVLISVDCAAPAYVSASTLAWRGVAALALADALESAGYSVQLQSVMRTNLQCSDGRAFDVDVLIKSVGEPLDLHRAANLLASPLLFRGTLLGLSYVMADCAVGGGCSYVSQDRVGVAQNAQGFDRIYFTDANVHNAATAQAWIDEKTKDLELANAA